METLGEAQQERSPPSLPSVLDTYLQCTSGHGTHIQTPTGLPLPLMPNLSLCLRLAPRVAPRNLPNSSKSCWQEGDTGLLLPQGTAHCSAQISVSRPLSQLVSVTPPHTSVLFVVTGSLRACQLHTAGPSGTAHPNQILPVAAGTQQMPSLLPPSLARRVHPRSSSSFLPPLRGLGWGSVPPATDLLTGRSRGPGTGQRPEPGSGQHSRAPPPNLDSWPTGPNHELLECKEMEAVRTNCYILQMKIQ